MLVLIGNAPSSGSTLLADLLDSTPYTACGPELNIFSNKFLYNFLSFKKNPFKYSVPASIYRNKVRPNFNTLPAYGLSQEGYLWILKNSPSIRDFFLNFSERFLILRGKIKNGTVFEKTPENLNVIKEFLNTNDQAYFIHIVRNPLDVYTSLIRRNFSHYMALNTWLVDVAQYIQFQNHPRLISIKYEDLMNKRFQLVSDIIYKITGERIKPIVIEKNFKNNEYRKIFAPRVKSWKMKEIGKIKANNLSTITDDLKRQFSIALNTKITERYAHIFNISPISFREAIQFFGYEEEIFKKIDEKINQKRLPIRNSEDIKRFTKKFIWACLNKQAKISDYRAFFNPVKIITK